MLTRPDRRAIVAPRRPGTAAQAVARAAPRPRARGRVAVLPPGCGAASARTRLAVVVALAIAAAWVGLAPAFAQGGPVVTLGANVLQAGQKMELDASGLKPDSAFTVTLTAPGGASQHASVRSDTSGALRFEHVLPQAGNWTIHLSGPGIDAPFTVQVTPNESGAPSAPQAPGGAPSTPAPSAPGAQGAPSTPPNGGQTQTPSPSQPSPSQPPTAQPPVAPAPSPALKLSIEQGNLVASRDGKEVWRLDFPSGSGATAGLARTVEGIYLGHGNSLLVIDPTDGHVDHRYALPAQVADVTAATNGVSVTVQYHAGKQQKLDVTPYGVAGTVRFDDDPAMFSWLRNEAAVANPGKRLAQDPTNPWLYVAAARQATDPNARAADDQQALAHATTFYERAQLARVFYGAGDTNLANQAMDAALRDYVDRGYTARLLTDPALRDAYGFPLSQLQSAVEQGNVQAAGFWAPWVYRMSTPAVPATQQALLDYSRALRSEGQRSEASLWQARAREGRHFRLSEALKSAALALGRAGWYGVAALLVAMAFLHLTLVAKYWRPQSVALRQRRESGRAVGRVPRLFAIRYYSLTEKFVLVLMFAAILALASLAGWANRGDRLPPAWKAGTLASVPARDAMSGALRTGPVADFVSGYGAQVAGDRQAASQAYKAAGDYAPALNNLGALDGNDALYQRALDVSAGFPEALYNLGRGTDPSRLHAAYASDVPLLAVPTLATLRAAVAGRYQDALGAAFSNPWAALTGFNPLAVPLWLWDVFVVLFLLWAAATVVYLFSPRPRLARSAPRTGAYHLLALLIPGSGLADELWGVVLLVPWAIFGIDTVLHHVALGARAAIPLATDYAVLAVIYALNVVAFAVELASYRSRMAELRRSFPDTARAYGMRPSDQPPE